MKIDKRFLLDSLKRGLKEIGVTAHGSVEDISPTKLFRITVVSEGFVNLRYFERQEVVWRIVKKFLSPEQLKYICAILVLTKSDMGTDYGAMLPLYGVRKRLRNAKS